MRFSPQQAQRMDDFLEKLEGQIYPETPSLLHSDITRHAVAQLTELLPLNAGTSVLDVGCSQGPALELFQQLGVPAVGITLGEEDVSVCRTRGYAVTQMDQSFLDFADASFDVLWARHVLEHSVFPLFTLAGFNRVLKPGGVLYVEVPAPDTACHHEQNPNHYSMLPRSSWISLLQRTGFEELKSVTYQFTVSAGLDEYWGFYCRKTEHNAGIW